MRRTTCLSDKMEFNSPGLKPTLRKLKLAHLIVLIGLTATPAFAEDWGAYSLVPASAPTLVLEAVDSGTTESTIVSIGKPAGTANQKWVVVSKGNDLFVVKPLHAPGLVLAASKGGVKNGTPIVLEADKGEFWQLWALKKNDNGTYCLIPKHAPQQGLDHLGG